MVLPLKHKTFGKRSLTCPKLAGFDLETDGLGGRFIIGAIYTSDQQYFLFDSLSNLFGWMLEHPEYRYLAHNAVGYEFAYLMPLIHEFFLQEDDVSIRPTIQGDDRIIQFVITVGKGRQKKVIDLRDTLVLFGMSLEKVANAFCPDLPKLKENIDFSKDTFDPTNRDHIAYVYRDCEIVVEAYQKHWDNMVEVFGSPLGVTAGSSALKAFLTTIPEDKHYFRPRKEVEDYIRLCYYGGLVLPGKRVGNWGETACVDVNGAYAYQMLTHKYPVRCPAQTVQFHEDHVGFYHVLATVPVHLFKDLGFNPVPRRTKLGLDWPSGQFDTYLTTPEIQYAREKGCEFTVLSGYVFFNEEYVFQPFIEKCQEMELVDGGKYKPTIKQNRNSCYGRFGMKAEHKTVVFSKETLTNQPYIPLTDVRNGHIIPGIYTGTETGDDACMLPHWAALICAYERLYLMRFVEKAYQYGAHSVYTDTDSIKCDLGVLLQMIADEVIPIGSRYGEFKLEDICNEFYLLGGKCFYGVLKENGKAVIKAKGIPNSALKPLGLSIYDETLVMLKKLQHEKKGKKKRDGRTEIHFTSVKSVMSILKERSHVMPIHRKRRITDIRNSYAWCLSDTGMIYPACYPEELKL